MATQMQLKTFRGPTMADALSAVKKALGSSAVIVHTRTYKIGGWMGLGARSVVEITATSDTPQSLATQRPTRRPQTAPTVTTTRPTPIAPRDPMRAVTTAVGARSYAAVGGASVQEPEQAAVALVEPPRRQPKPDPQEFIPGLPLAGASEEPAGEADAPDFRAPARASDERRLIPRARAEQLRRITTEPEVASAAGSPVVDELLDHAAREVKPRPAKLTVAAERLAVRAPIAPVDERARSTLEDELNSIRRMMTQVLQASRQAARGQATVGGMPDALAEQYGRLIDAGVAGDLADEIVGLVRDELSPSELADAGVVRQGVLNCIARMIRVTGAGPRAEHRGRPSVVALVGPTGVGKTTTLAKLAASLKLRHGKQIGLITCDTYRIAAVEQLRTYANIIGLPLKVVMSPAEIGQAIESLDECDAVLIDTPGRSQHDRDRLGELCAFCEAASPDETHLVLSTTVSPAVLARTAERFVALDPDRVILTKLDEAVGLGSVLGVLRSLGRPVSYVTTGQEVPDHIELANGDRLARAILDGADEPMAAWGARPVAAAGAQA